MRMPIVHHARQNFAGLPAKTTSSKIALFDMPVHRQQTTLQVMPDDHSELAPPLPIPNRTVKRLRADDSAATSVKVGNRQALIKKSPASLDAGLFAFDIQLGNSCLIGRIVVRKRH